MDGSLPAPSGVTQPARRSRGRECGSPQPGDCVVTGRPDSSVPWGAEPGAAWARRKGAEGRAMALRLLAPSRMHLPASLTVAPALWPPGPQAGRGPSGTRLSWLWPRFQHPGTMALGQAVQVPLNPPAQRSPRLSQMPQPQRRDRPLGWVMGQKGLAAGPAHSLRERPPSVATRLALRLLNREGRGHLLWAPWPPAGSGA